MKIVEDDYWEYDAMLEMDGKRYYFQFPWGTPMDGVTIEHAVEFFRKEGRLDLVEKINNHLGFNATIIQW